MDEAQELLAHDDLHVDTLRIRAFPFALEVGEFFASTNRCSSSSRTATPRCALSDDRSRARAAQLAAILHYDGMPITARFIAGKSLPIVGARLRRNVGAPFRDLSRPSRNFIAPTAVNELGYTHRDYEGSMSTLCAGCGHDSISAAIIHACFEFSLPPHRIAKFSGIGCSSKTPTYMLGQSHGFNSVHGRMPSVLTAPISPTAIQLSRRLRRRRHRFDRPRPVRPCHAPGRQHGLYRREQRRVWADQGRVLGHRRPRFEEQEGRSRLDQPIDLVGMAIGLGATFVGRSFSGDKANSCR